MSDAKNLQFEDAILFYNALLGEVKKYGPQEQIDLHRHFAKTDLFFLLVYVLHRKDMAHPWLYERCREVEAEPNGHLDLWAREHYKAVDLNEPVPTPTGWKPHGSLDVGDWVYGADGSPVRVVAKTEVFTDAECYEVSFEDGYRVTVSAQHLWEVERHTRKREGNGRVYREKVVLNTKEIASHSHKPDKRFAVPVAPALLNVEHILTVHPYVLGCWLGDGNTDGGVITCGDADVFAEIERSGYAISAGRPSKPITKSVYGLVTGLKEISVFKNKHIPREYLWASEAQRLALLQGLMDTDGSCTPRGTCTFVNKNLRLANDVFELCASLGLKPRFNEFEYDHGMVYHVSFQGYKEQPVFRIPRKLARCKDGQRKPRRFIVSVKPVESIPVSCIQVDAADGLYLIGRHMVTTHNSTVITFGLTIQDILKNPEVTICIFSHTKPQAKKFLSQIKFELENNTDLKAYFPDILWETPSNAPRWTEDSLVVKRKNNPKEATLQAHGLVDGMPTGMHFSHRIYDDVVTDKSVTNPDMVKKVDDALALSVDLGMTDGIERYIGTRYSNFDSYKTLLERKVLIPRVHPACPYTVIDGGKIQIHFDQAVLKTPEELMSKFRKQGAYIFGCQQLQNPVSDATKQLSVENLRYWDVRPGNNMNRCIIVDPASGKKSKVKKKGKQLDYTIMWVLARGADDNWYLIDGVHDRLNLTQRAKALIKLHEIHRPHYVFYEEYGMQADIAHIKYEQEQLNYRFEITEIGGPMAKHSRIMRLQPVIDAHRLYLPRSLQYTNVEGKVHNLIRDFIDNELAPYPVVMHDDMLDCLSRICDDEVQQMVTLPKGTSAIDRSTQIINKIRQDQRRHRPLV